MSNDSNIPHVEALVLDAHPLITETFNVISKYAQTFYTTPTVFKEIKDENARKNLEIWKDKLILKQARSETVQRVIKFAKLTGDYGVLSIQDIHIIALALELEIEKNGMKNIKNFPGERKVKKEEVKEVKEEKDDWNKVEKKKHRRRGGKKQREKREASNGIVKEVEKLSINEESENKQIKQVKEDTEESKENVEEVEEVKEVEETKQAKETNKDTETENIEANEIKEVGDTEEITETTEFPNILQEVNHEYNPEDFEGEESDDGEWITSENLVEIIKKDSGEKIEDIKTFKPIKVALSSQDFAVQNVSIQMGIKLMNISTGLQIKQIRNYMMRCHACFKLQSLNESKDFCNSCGGNTLLRCPIIINSKTGEIKPLLKKNFEWHNRGNKYSLPSPLSKNTKKKLGKAGFQHNKNSKNYDIHNNKPILRADQDEYFKALKNENWVNKQNEKFLENWIGGGSADNFYSPFANGDSSNRFNSSNVKVNKGRFVNASRRK